MERQRALDTALNRFRSSPRAQRCECRCAGEPAGARRAAAAAFFQSIPTGEQPGDGMGGHDVARAAFADGFPTEKQSGGGVDGDDVQGAVASVLNVLLKT